ncbi:hypothetical protein COCOBI_16-1320 [Coccomyxa sp. Obi]|nr:hypothetical protein COCOBI_16-1320 [Coccomyxa sp. Obi]
MKANELQLVAQSCVFLFAPGGIPPKTSCLLGLLGHRFRKPGVEKAYGRVLETTESVEAIQRQAYLLDEEDGADAFPKLLELINTGEWLARCLLYSL